MREGWREVTLGELCTLTKGTTPTQKATPGPYPLIVTAQQPLTSNEYRFEGEAVCVPLVSSTGHGHASLKRVHYAHGRFAVANIICALQAREASLIDMRFLWLYLDHLRNVVIVPLMKGTANVSLSQGALARAHVVLPPISEQRRIVDLIGAVDAVVTQGAALRTTAGELRLRTLAARFGAGRGVPVGSLLDRIEGGRSPKAVDVSPAVGEAGVLKVSAVQGTGFRPRESKRLIDPSIFQAHHEVREGDALITRANTAEKVGAACLVGSLEGEASLFLSDKTL